MGRSARVSLGVVIVSVVVVLGYLEGHVVFRSLQRALLFPTYAVRVPSEPNTLPEEGEQLWLEKNGARIEAWLLPPTARDSNGEDRQHPAVIFGHGNAESIDDWPRELEWYRRRGFYVLLPEYRGYGRSTGKPGEAQITSDLVDFYDRLVAKSAVDGESIVFHGRSLGGGAVCQLLEHRPARALILQSTFTSIDAIAWRHYFAPGFLVTDHFDNLEVISEVEIPVLILHGKRDELIPHSHGRKLHRAASNSRFVSLARCGHNCPTPWSEVGEFLADQSLIE